MLFVIFFKMIEFVFIIGMVINCVVYYCDGCCMGDIMFDVISDVLEQLDMFVWVGLYELDEVLLEKLQEEFDLYDLVIEDVYYVYQCIKIEVYGDLLFIVVQIVQLVVGKFVFGEIYIFLGLCYLVIVCYGVLFLYVLVWCICEYLFDLLVFGFSYGFYGVFDFIVDNLMLIVCDFCEELQEFEQDIFVEVFNCDIVKCLYDMQCDLMILCLVVVLLQDVISQLVWLYFNFILEDLCVYFCDVYDYVFCVNELVSVMCEMFGVMININLFLVIFGQNEVMKKFVGWVVMFVVFIFIISWYGMNFYYMFELDKLWVYLMMIVLVIVVVVGIFIWLCKLCWLQLYMWCVIGFVF